jgi:hypothetical protein
VTLHNPSPLEIDPRACSVCGATLDRHEPIDDDEGPIFYCLPPDAMTLPELERRAELIRLVEVAAMVKQWELADPRDRWRHTGETPPRPPAEPPRRHEPYRSPESTMQAFWYVARLDDPDYLTRWLDQHPADAPHLFKLWKAKQCAIKT